MHLKDERKSKTALRESKNCIVCLRSFENRKKWSSRNIWEDIKYCSQKCRNMKNSNEYKNKFQK
jgi:hypothetical protein